MVARTRLHVMLHVHCLYFFFWDLKSNQCSVGEDYLNIAVRGENISNWCVYWHCCAYSEKRKISRYVFCGSHIIQSDMQSLRTREFGVLDGDKFRTDKTTRAWSKAPYHIISKLEFVDLCLFKNWFLNSSASSEWFFVDDLNVLRIQTQSVWRHH